MQAIESTWGHAQPEGLSAGYALTRAGFELMDYALGLLPARPQGPSPRPAGIAGDYSEEDEDGGESSMQAYSGRAPQLPPRAARTGPSPNVSAPSRGPRLPPVPGLPVRCSSFSVCVPFLLGFRVYDLGCLLGP
jgi:hypothetical protein